MLYIEPAAAAAPAAAAPSAAAARAESEALLPKASSETDGKLTAVTIVPTQARARED